MEMAGESRADEPGNIGSKPIPFGEKFAESEKFSAVFQEGMALVEATAAYLDSDGRKDAKSLQPPASLAYATESMRLTTRLMQLASWLLIRRAVNEGELTPEQALEEKTKVKLKPEQGGKNVEGYDALPDRLRELIDASLHLNRRILRLDHLLHAEHGMEPEHSGNPLENHMARLRAEYSPGRK